MKFSRFIGLFFILYFSIYKFNLLAKESLECKNSIDLLIDQKFEEAAQSFGRIISSDVNQESKDQASFYLALSQLELGNLENALLILEDLEKKKVFSEKDSVYVNAIIAKIYLKQNNLEFSSILDNIFSKKKIDKLFLTFFTSFFPKNLTLDQFILVYVSVSSIALKQLLWEQMQSKLECYQKQSYDFRSFLKRNNKKINTKKELFTISDKKDKYSIVVFFSINEATKTVSSQEYSRFLGTLAAIKKIQKMENIADFFFININSIDNLYTESVDDLKYVDMILYLGNDENIAKASSFALQYQIPLIDFSSKELSTIGNNPLHFMLNTTPLTENEKANDFICSKIKENDNICFIYSSHENDLEKVKMIKSILEEKKIDTSYVELNNTSASQLLMSYIKHKNKKYSDLPEDFKKIIKANFIYVITTDEFLVSSLVNFFHLAELSKVHIIFSDKIFSYESIDLDQLLLLETYYISTNYIDIFSSEVEEIKEICMNLDSQYLDNEIIRAYTLTIFFYNLLLSYGDSFYLELFKDKKFKLPLNQVISFGEFNDNQNIDILYMNHTGIRLMEQ